MDCANAAIATRPLTGVSEDDVAERVDVVSAMVGRCIASIAPSSGSEC